ncbi:hypothetical protein HG535_0D05370 [Zygotorulaspora mrakii]|uniref:Ubiquitin-like domain-containing protein n=1 Tax=Zygotorulaspora mrakii TaxID=42260 RepID=A0A7H9B2E2_ZYGMR|nr:uncharacterized protein HG535_0D05370 [Zygotorulaspora mrakii]QLG72828.1 hypothetical protein HG535_0D05370 [Zygotorulaspora mrakii]
MICHKLLLGRVLQLRGKSDIKRHGIRGTLRYLSNPNLPDHLHSRMLLHKDGMMECLALAPLKVIVWSSDKGLIRTNIVISAHPRTAIGRLVEYIYSQLSEELKAMDQSGNSSYTDRGDLGSVSDYCIYYRSKKEQPVDITLQDLESSGNISFIRLLFDKRGTHTEEPINSQYEINANFKTTNLLININALSVDKIMSQMELNVPMGLTVKGLKEIAMKVLYEYEEGSNSKNLCLVKNNHSIADILAFIVKGDQSPVYLNDSNAELYDDLTLTKILGCDFAPQKQSYFTVMFKVTHAHLPAECLDNSITIEFISDSTLSVNKMSVTTETSVEEVKEFICSAYTHSLRLSTNDIKLIYKGQLIHTLDFAGQPSKITDYINGTDGAKIHVHINQEYNEPGPGFWSELFNGADRFEFLPQRNLESQPMMPSFSSQSRVTLTPMSPPETQLPLMEVSDQAGFQFSTESSLSLLQGDEPYFKCLVDGKDEVFVPAHVLEPAAITLEIDDSKMSLSSLDYTIENGIIKLSPKLISRLESKFDMEIMRKAIIGEDFDNLTNQNIMTAHQMQQGNRITFFTRILPVLLLVFRTLYLIGNNSIVPFFFILELSTFLSWKYTALIAILFLLRTIWSTREIWEIWSDHFSLSEIDDESYIKIKEHITSKSLSQDFFKECISSDSVIDIFMSSTLRDSREHLYEAYNIEHANESNGVASLKALLENVSNRDIEKGPIDEFMISCLCLYETTRYTMPETYQNSMRRIFVMVKRDLTKQTNPEQLPLHKKMLRGFRIAIERFRQSQVSIIVLEHVVPDPRQDTLIASIVKNIVLFFLIILPPIKNKVDTILEERARAHEHINEDEKDEELHSEDDILLISEQPSVTTGLQLHDQEAHDHLQEQPTAR